MCTSTALFIDIDGTLRNNNHEITPRTIDALKTVQHYNYLPILCTGNPYLYSARLSQEFDGTYVISSTGATIYNCKTQALLYENSINQSNIQKLHQLIHGSGSDYVFSLDGEYVRISTNYTWEELQIKIKNYSIPQIVLENYNFDYMLRICDQIKLMPSLQIANQSKLLTQKTAGPEHTKYSCDILNSGITKASGIQKFCKLLNIPKDNTIGIGDDLNDRDMFSACAYNVAMGNALEQVKLLADYVTLDNEHDGLAYFIEHRLLANIK